MIELVAPAKLTWSLRVLGTRPDGYHVIDAEMVSLDLADHIQIEPRPDGEPSAVRYLGPMAPSRPIDPADDLVLRALAVGGRSASVTVTKHIPAGAGLGGGSSDAAAVLRWCGVTDHAVAAGVGADVAFCLTGGRARVSGIGEIVRAEPYVERTVTLVTPPIHCSTPVVYRRWDELTVAGRHDPSGNDLTAAALSAYPDLARWRDELASATGREPRLAGSGATWFVEGDATLDGSVVAHTVDAHPSPGAGNDGPSDQG